MNFQQRDAENERREQWHERRRKPTEAAIAHWQARVAHWDWGYVGAKARASETHDYRLGSAHEVAGHEDLAGFAEALNQVAAEHGLVACERDGACFVAVKPSPVATK